MIVALFNYHQIFLTRERNALVISLRPLFKFVFHRVHSVDVTRSISQWCLLSIRRQSAGIRYSVRGTVSNFRGWSRLPWFVSATSVTLHRSYTRWLTMSPFREWHMQNGENDAKRELTGRRPSDCASSIIFFSFASLSEWIIQKISPQSLRTTSATSFPDL